MQADASKSTSLSKVFTSASGKPYTYIFNCGGETRYSQDPSVYSLRNTQLSLNLALHCASLPHRPVLIEFSTGMIYKPSQSVSTGGCPENAALKPWLKIAKAKLEAEQQLESYATEKGLRHATLRLAHVYGPYDVGFLARGLCLARVYQELEKEMKWLWGPSLRINTVHVNDVCTAAWAAAEWASSPANAPTASTTMNDRAFNICDDGDSSQQTLADIIHKVFQIPTGFQGTLISKIAKMKMDDVVDDVNEDVLAPWAELVRKKGVEGPLSPFMEKELLRDCDLCLANGRAKSVLGWRAEKKAMGEEEIRAVLKSYEAMGWWP